MKKLYAVEVHYDDRRQGPSRWRHRVEAQSIKTAIHRGVLQFFRAKVYTGRSPSRKLAVFCARVDS